MDIKNIQKKERKNIFLSLRVKKSDSVWMKEKKISPQRLFDTALKELQEKSK